jgi:type II secretory pathway component PulM
MFIVTVGVAEIVYAVQIRTWHGRGSWTGDPPNAIFVASWLASEMWIDLRVLLAGGLTLVFAVVFFLVYRPATRHAPTERSGDLIR